MVTLPCAPDHRRIDRTGRSRARGADMLSMTAKRTTRIAALLAGAMATVALTGTAQAATYRVAGEQVAIKVDASGAGEYKMLGGLRGMWTINELNEVSTSPYYEAQGTELFKGCIDRRRDRSCKGDPSGTLSFTIRYWALFGSADPSSLVWGACWHPVVAGTGDFAGAQGVMTMVDSPTERGVKTAYIGTLTLAGTGAASARAAKSSAAPRRLGC
jgi:hypothetical protein